MEGVVTHESKCQVDIDISTARGSIARLHGNT